MRCVESNECVLAIAANRCRSFRIDAREDAIQDGETMTGPAVPRGASMNPSMRPQARRPKPRCATHLAWPSTFPSTEA